MAHRERSRGTLRGRARVALTLAALVLGVLALVPGSSASAGEVQTAGTLGDGYFFVATDGGIFNFGDSEFKGSTGNINLNQPIVGAESTPTGEGYWLVAADGGIFTFGDAKFLGSTGDIKLNKPIVAMVATPTGNGYWLFATDGGVFTFGDATFYGSTGNIALNKPIVGAESTPTGTGYYLVASDGGIFTFGDAAFHGSTGSMKLNKPIVGMATTDDGSGYYLVATDGGIFTFGKTPEDAPFFGSTGSLKLNQPIVGMDLTPSNQGYYLVAADGGIFTFGDAKFAGSTGNIKLNKPIVGMSVTPFSPVRAPDFVLNLRGSAEVPGPGDPDGTGFAFLDFTDDELCYAVRVDGISTSTAMHIHEAVPGVSGPVLVDLGKLDANGSAAACIDVPAATIAKILADPRAFYLNAHSTELPAGAVRGQLEGDIAVAITRSVVNGTPTGSIVAFDTEFPAATQDLGKLPASIDVDKVLAADFRPKEQPMDSVPLYVLVRASATTVQLVKVDETAPGSGVNAATNVGGPIAVSAAATSFGMDFNPTADLVRIVDDADDNLRVNPDTGVLAGTDTALNYAGGDPNNGTDPNVTAAAYTNSRPAAATTVLYDIDTALDVLVTQAPPATGALTTVGSLGVDLSNVTSFDIAPSTEALPNAPAYIATTRTGAIPSNQAELFAVNLASTTTGNVPGKVASLGTIGSGTSTVVAFSII